jgi:hypothetical protein
MLHYLLNGQPAGSTGNVHRLPPGAISAYMDPSQAEQYGGLYVLRTPLSVFQPADDYFRENLGSKDVLGDIPTLWRNGLTSVVFGLDSEPIVYDLIRNNKNGLMADRIYVADSTIDNTQIGTTETVDNLKVRILVDSGISIEETFQVPMQIVSIDVTSDGEIIEQYYGYTVGGAIISFSGDDNVMTWYDESDSDLTTIIRDAITHP